MNIKKILIISVFAIIVTSLSFLSVYSFPGGGAIDGPSLERGLVGYWKLDSKYGVKDVTPYSNHGTAGGGITIGGVTGRMGQVNTATSFDGSNDSVDVGTIAPTESATFSSWLYINGANVNYGAIFTNWGTGGNAFFIGTQNNKSDTIEVYFNGSLRFRIGNIPLNEWVHLAVVHTGSAVTAYINGSQTNQAAATLRAATGTTSIGYDINRTNYPFKGNIQDARIYKRALSQEEINLLYSSYMPQLKVSSLDRGLIGHWTLDQDRYNPNNNRVDDLTPYGNHGNNYGATFIQDRLGKNGGAMSYNGSDNYVDFSPFNATSATEGTLSAWIRTDNLNNANRRIVEVGETTKRVGLFMNGGKLYLYGAGSSSGIINILTTLTYNDNNWHHVVGVWNSSGSKLYVNGLEKKSVSGDMTFSLSPTSTGRIGQYVGGGNYYFNGFIDDVRIYDRSLSQQEIGQLYSSYKPKITSNLQKGLVLDMPLTSTYTKSSTPGSEIMTDRTPYSNDGQNFGATLSSDGASFNGVSNYVDCGNTTSLNAIGGTTNISVSAWAYYNAYGGGGQSYSVITVKGNPWTWLLENPSNIFRFRITAGGSDVNVQDTSTHSLNTWYHVVGTYDGLNMKIYVNGILKNTKPQTGVLGTNTQTAKIGTYQGSNYNLNGKISNVKIYNRTLTPEEVSLLYSRGR